MNYKELNNQLKEYIINSDEFGEYPIIYVYPKNNDGSVNLDVGMKLENPNGIWCLFRIQRNRKLKQGDFPTKEVGLIALYIAVKGIYDKVKGDHQVKSELRKVEKDLEDGKVIQKSIKENYFTLIHEKEGTINLYVEDQTFDVYYMTHEKVKIMITEARPLSSALVILYNFSIKLQKFDELIKPYAKNIELKEKEKLKRIYIGK